MDPEKIKEKCIIALVSDDELMQKLVLKGGNAINIIYKLYNRTSVDLDFSINGDFEEEELPKICQRIEKSLNQVFKEEGCTIIDFRFEQRPVSIKPSETGVWGGYIIGFKIVRIEDYQKFEHKIESLRKRAIKISSSGQRKVTIELSKHEYCQDKEEHEVNGFIVYVYTPTMIAIEKIRAICQQTEVYKEMQQKPNLKGRAKDFLDIYVLVKTCKLNLLDKENIRILSEVFKAKNVPLELLGDIEKYKGVHEPTWGIVQETIEPSFGLKDFSYYFEYVVSLSKELLDASGVKKSPSI